MENSSEWVDVGAALRLLGVKRETLYAYVSRGHVRSKPMGGKSRASLYAASDLGRMAAKRRRPRKRAEVAKSTINWGEPILETRISTVRDGRLIFGKMDACTLADTYSLEETAFHHWQCRPGVARRPDHVSSREQSAKARAFSYLAARSTEYPPSLGRSRQELCEDAPALLSGFANNVIGRNFGGSIHERLGQAWNLRPAETDIIRRALVLLSDHELNASTFAVRVAASTGAPLPAAALAGLAALSGPLHGVAAVNASTYLNAAMRAKSEQGTLQRYLASHPEVPGMGHNFYPQGDIRAKNLIAALNPPSEVLEVIAELETHTGLITNIDMAQAALSYQLKLPTDAGFILFAIARMSGWIAHAMEQVESGKLIRPRAVFTG